MDVRDRTVARAAQHISAAPDEIFEYWIDPDRVKTWMFPSESDKTVRAEINATVGGAFSFVVHRDGEDINHTGEYLEIERPRRLVVLWGVTGDVGSDRVAVDITPIEDDVEVALEHELHPDWADYVDHTEDAWQSMLRSLAANLD